MPSIFFGRSVSGKKGNNAAVDTTRGWMEPVEPSKFKIYTKPNVTSFLYSIMSTILGHIVSVLSFPMYSFLPLHDFGEMFKIPKELVEFSGANFGFCLLRGETMSEENTTLMERRGFRTLVFAKNLVWLKENAKRSDYISVTDNIPKIDPKGRVPDRYLNYSGFASYLQLMNLTTRICETFHSFTETGSNIQPTTARLRISQVKGWKNIHDYADDPDVATVTGEDTTPTFTDPKAFLFGPVERVWSRFVLLRGSTDGTAFDNSGAVLNPLREPSQGFISAGDTSAITTHGKVFKFIAGLALPDINFVGDVIGRRFLTCLGSSREEQFSNLDTIKKGLSGLRLTSLGDEMVHLYKCLDTAIDAQCGCVPFFTGPVYEGCVLMGGVGASFSVNGEIVEFEGVTDLKDEFLTVSSHSTALDRISNKFPATLRDHVKGVKTMVALRKLCLSLECSADDRDYIQQQAGNLEFGPRHWVISPAKLDDCFSLLSDLSRLQSSDPISRLCLFSRDAVLIALSCFGEKSCPSWDIPQGTLVPITTPNPPIVPASVKGSSKSGVISDATWVMTIRKTDLPSACDEFRRMAAKGGYRSVSSILGRKQGMSVFSRDQMAKFWGNMQEAFRHVNPDVKLATAGDSSGKRKAADSGEGPAGVSGPKRRALGI